MSTQKCHICAFSFFLVEWDGARPARPAYGKTGRVVPHPTQPGLTRQPPPGPPPGTGTRYQSATCWSPVPRFHGCAVPPRLSGKSQIDNKEGQRTSYRGLAPDWLEGGREQRASFTQPGKHVLVRSGAARASWPSVGRSLSSQEGRRSPAGAAFTGSPRPSPRRSFKPLGGTVEGFRCSAYGMW